MKKSLTTRNKELGFGKRWMFLTVKGLALTLSLGMFLIACDDSDPETDPEEIISIKINPKEVNFDEIGQSQEFTAKAYDEDGREISTLFEWSSSNVGVVAIDSNGMAEAIGPGNASIYVTSEGITDTAQVVVEVADISAIWWVAATDGDWSNASNWSTGVVPSPTDSVAIPLSGDYTVTLTADVTIEHLLLGAFDGTQKLATGSNQLTIERGKLIGGAELQVDGNITITNKVEWVDGEITGSGTFEVAREAELLAGGGESKLILKATLLNNGTFAVVSDVSIDINGGTFENTSGARLDFKSDGVNLNVFSGGTINNLGNIFKSEGFGDARISASSGTLITSGFIGVESGNLHINGGDLDGVIDVDENAEFHQAGNTLIRSSLISSGDGVFEINGTVTLGEYIGDLIRFNNVVFDSWNTTNGISGPGDLQIKNSLLWRNGGITGAGNVFIDGANVRFQGANAKVLSERVFKLDGLLETESSINLTLLNGAQIIIDASSEWIHTGGSTIKKGSGTTSGITILGTFRKKGEGTLVVETDFVCAGQMYLEEDVLTVQGAFNLQETGRLIGGGTNTQNEVNYRRLQVSEATSAILAGTIELDADGDLAYMSIQGAVTIESTFNVLVDIDKNNDLIPAERLVFLNGGVTLNGTLDINIINTDPPENVEYRVISTINGTGAFANITGSGAAWFTEIRQDADGVLLIRN